jgi:hypothetical protein
MIVWWLGNIVLLVVVLPAVVICLKGVLTAAKQIVPNIQTIVTVAAAATKDLEPIPLLLTTQSYIIKTVEIVANYGGSLEIVLDDA